MSDARVLPASAEKALKKAAADLASGDEVKAKRAEMWGRKALKIAKGLRSTSMVPGEDGLSDKEKVALLDALKVKPEKPKQFGLKAQAA